MELPLHTLELDADILVGEVGGVLIVDVVEFWESPQLPLHACALAYHVPVTFTYLDEPDQLVDVPDELVCQ